jgi:voltage-gated potassium channel
MPPELWKDHLRQLYEGETLRGVRFRYALLALDVVTVLFIVATSFVPRTRIVEALDVVFGMWILRISRRGCSSADNP